MRVLFEQLGAKVTWNGKTKTVKAVQAGTTIEMTVGSKTAKVNGKTVTMNVAPRMEKSGVLIPVRFVSETLGMYVTYYANDRQVYVDKDTNIEGTTMAGVKALYEKYKPRHRGEVYDEQPSFSGTFKAGKLKASFLQDAINATNFVREMAKLPTLTMDAQINADTQIGTTVQAAQGGVTHNPIQASGMPNDFYATGLQASKDSSLATTSKPGVENNFDNALMRWTSDPQASDLGHRKAVLDTRLKATGFGYSYNSSSSTDSITVASIAMNEREITNSAFSGYDYISWPSKGYFPVEWTQKNMSFSVTLNPEKYDIKDSSTYSVKVTNKTTGSVFTPTYDEGELYRHPASRGAGQTLSFQFRDENNYEDVPTPGTEYEVNITGVTKTDGTPYPINYTVKFFAM